MKKMKFKTLFLMFVLILIIFDIVSDVQTYFMREQSEEYRLFDDILREYGIGPYSLEVEIDFDKKENSIIYSLKQKRGLDILRKSITWEDVEKMRVMMNTYLVEHPDYYLNDNYKIFVNIQQANQMPWMAFTNDKERLKIEGLAGLYDRLDCIIIKRTPDSRIPVHVFKEAKGFYFQNPAHMETNYEILSQMSTLEYSNPPLIKSAEKEQQR